MAQIRVESLLKVLYFFIGVSFVGHELLLAILTLLFFYHNEKLQGIKHKCNSKIVPVFPPRTNNDRKVDKSTSLYKTSDKNLITSDTNANRTLIDAAFQIIGATRIVVAEMENMCLHRGFRGLDILNKTQYRDFSLDDCNDHKDMLIYNMNSFGVEIIEVPKDGDCCFRSILLQLGQIFRSNIDNESLKQHFDSLELGKSIDDDISRLRYGLNHFLNQPILSLKITD